MTGLIILGVVAVLVAFILLCVFLPAVGLTLLGIIVLLIVLVLNVPVGADAAYITKALEQRKPPVLSQPALETLAVVAYFQPVTRAYVDQVRGVDSSYTVSMLQDRGLIE